jgi:hypothetical protein
MQNSKRKAAYNSTYPKGGVSCSKDSFVVNHPPRRIKCWQTVFVFEIRFFAKRPTVYKLYFTIDYLSTKTVEWLN